jgi:hypothetical protein
MQCREMQGVQVKNTYLNTSYFTPPLEQWTKRKQLFISLAFHFTFALDHFSYFHPYHLHLLITSYFTPPLASMDKKITHYH